MQFTKAEKKGIRARIANLGLSGSGKTWWSLEQAAYLAKVYGTTVAFIDSERGSAKKYADQFDFDVLELVDDFGPQRYIEALELAGNEGYGIVVVDSLSHAWSAKGGLLEQVDKIAARSKSGNTFTAWREASPIHNDFVDAMLAYPGHLIATMRTKTEYTMQQNEKGKMVPVKLGMAPIQRDGLEYEFDIVADIDLEHNWMPSKTRCPALTDQVFRKGEHDKLMKAVVEWLGDQKTIPAAPDFDREKALTRLNIALDTIFGGNKDEANVWVAKMWDKHGWSSENPADMTDSELEHLLKLCEDKYRAEKKKAS